MKGNISMKKSEKELKALYKKMASIRTAEEAFQNEFYNGNVPGFLHLYLGEEAIASGICMALNKDDFITSTHRGHGHFIAKGSDLRMVAAEIMGKKTGLCEGRGGSMHMTDMENGILGTTGIVGAGFPLAVGMGLAFQKNRTEQVSVCFFGDGAVNEGTFHEAVNLSAIWNLPVIFVCENNLYAQSTPQEYHQKIKDIYKRAEGYGIAGEMVDGMDAESVWDAAEKAVERARNGEGPTFIECKTYLYSGHYVGDAKKYRYSDEMEYYRDKRDCIKLFKEKMIASNILSKDDFIRIDNEVEKIVNEAIAFAKNSPYPAPEEVTEHVYKTY